MDDFVRPPRQEEVQYAKDIIGGKRRFDTRVIIAATVAGALMGVAIGIAGNRDNESFDLVLLVACIGAVAFCFFIISLLILASIRTIKAVCSAWFPGKVITIISGALYAANLLKSIPMRIIVPSTFIPGLAMTLLGLIFLLLLYTVGLRFIFFIYCLATGKDDEKITADHIAAQNDQHGKTDR